MSLGIIEAKPNLVREQGDRLAEGARALRGFRLYERFRPEVPAGASGWGAKGELKLGALRVPC